LLIMRKPRALLLDFYGTVVREDDEVVAGICEQASRNCPDSATSAAQIAHAWWSEYTALTSRSHGPAFRTQRDIARASLAAALGQTGSTADPDTLLQAQFAYWRSPAIYSDARDVLNAGLPVCLVSNIDRPDLDAALDCHQLTGCFRFVVTSEDARAYKPRPEMFTAALGLLGVATHEVLHIGDSLSSDVLGAVSLDMPVAWINRNNRQHRGSPRPTHEVRDLTALRNLLR
jgi:2-haloacid dehalogenase/putative hydrolase of the HAD superfamily